MTNPVSSIPNAADDPSNSQAQLKTNFDSLIAWAAVDHVGFGASNSGDHNQTTMPAGSDPGSSSGFIRTYAKSQTTALGTFTEQYMQSDGTRGPVQMTYATPSIGAASNTNGYTFLPGGILLQWGNVTATTGGTPFTFPVAFPAYVFAVTIGGRATGAQAFSIGAPALNSVTVYSASGSQVCYVMAIGK